jgi:sec-independent protein translocase protein TatC
MAMTEILRSRGYEGDAADSALDGSDVRDKTRETTSAEMSVVEHLEELRWRLFVCAVTVVIGAIVAFVFYEPVLQLLLSPLPSKANVLAPHNGKPQLAVTGIGEGFSVVLKLAIAVGIALATPVWLYQLWGFISPGLTRRERHYALPFTLVGVALFLTGLGVGFLTLRYPLNWLLSFGDQYFIEIITADNYFTFVAYFLLAFGLAFELPLVLTFLAVIGVLSAQTLKKNRATTLVGLWITSCFITPGADPYSPLILGIAFTVLYFISEGLIHLINRESGDVGRTIREPLGE